MGRTSADGAPIIGRIVTDSDEHSVLFIARQSKNATLPGPFLPATQVIALHWSAEPWRERAFAPQEVEQIYGSTHHTIQAIRIIRQPSQALKFWRHAPPFSAIAVADTRPPLSFSNLTFQPEYDPDLLLPALDPSVNNTPEYTVTPPGED